MRRLVAVVLGLAAAVGFAPADGTAQTIAAPGSSTLSVGQALHAFSGTEHLVSPSGAYTLSVLPMAAEIDQTIRVRDGGTQVMSPTWSTPMFSGDGDDNSTLVLQTDGNLVLYTANRRVLWASGTRGSGATRLVMQDDGNLVLYPRTGRAVWSTHTGPAVLAPGQVLTSGHRLVNGASNVHGGPYTRLVMQTDGNLVLYFGAHAVWSTRTFVAGSFVRMQTDGNLVLYSPGRRALWSSRTQRAGANTWTRVEQCGRVTVNSLERGVVWSARPAPVPGC